jgi:hypothetical protein
VRSLVVAIIKKPSFTDTERWELNV